MRVHCPLMSLYQARLVLTDNLAPFLRSPARSDAAAYFNELSMDLVEHSSLWGGAIQFAHVQGRDQRTPARMEIARTGERGRRAEPERGDRGKRSAVRQRCGDAVAENARKAACGEKASQRSAEPSVDRVEGGVQA